MLRGEQSIEAKKYEPALADFRTALAIPDNLPLGFEGGAGIHNAEVAYWSGVAYEGMGDHQKAVASWERAAPATPVRRRRASGDDLTRKPELYYQGLALQKLGKGEEAKAIFQGLVAAGQQALASQKAASGPELSPRARKALAHYITGLGYLGLNDQAGARAELSQAVQTDPGLAQAWVALAAAAKRS